MGVLVIGMTGHPLMPMKKQKARKLLKAGKAEIVRRTPFTIRLKYKTGSTTQKIRRGVDTGSQHIGIAVVRLNENGDTASVCIKLEIVLRTTMEKRKLMEARKGYRRGRRHRKVRYRHPKTRFRTRRHYCEEPDKKGRHWQKKSNRMQTDRPKGWLPPSIDSKIKHHVQWIKWVDEALPDPEGVIEIARFDMARMKDPTIHGEMYQKGRMYDYENVRAYVLARDGYKCRICGAKAGTRRKDGTVVKLRSHHIDYRSKGATNNPDGQIAVCDCCHKPVEHLSGGELDKLMRANRKKAQGLRGATFMNILRKRLYHAFPEDTFTYGNITKPDREALHLKKTHANDAVAIALKGIDTNILNDIDTVIIQQQRKKKRSLHEAKPRKGRSKPNKEAKRNDKNKKEVIVEEGVFRKDGVVYPDHKFALYDKVSFEGKVGWITGFTGKSAYVKDANDEYITASALYKQIPLSRLVFLGRNNNWIVGPVTHLGKE